MCLKRPQILDTIFAELASRSDEEGYIFATDEDLDKWASTLGLSWLAALDVIGAELARRYDSKQVNFAFGDSLANDLESTLIFRHQDVPEDGWPMIWSEVYEAFDAGEWRPADDPDDPVLKFTNPAISDIVAKLG